MKIELNSQELGVLLAAIVNLRDKIQNQTDSADCCDSIKAKVIAALMQPGLSVWTVAQSWDDHDGEGRRFEVAAVCASREIAMKAVEAAAYTPDGAQPVKWVTSSIAETPNGMRWEVGVCSVLEK